MSKRKGLWMVLVFVLVMSSMGACRIANTLQVVRGQNGPTPGITLSPFNLTPSPSSLAEGEGSVGSHGTTPPPIKPADAEMPAAGICGQTEGQIAEIRLNDPPPPDPRCLQVAPDQFLRVVNASAREMQVRLAHYDLLIPAGGETVFDLPLGAFLAPGVHQLSPAGEIWVREAAVTGDTPPTHQQFTNFELGYSFFYPSDWTVDDYGLTQPNKEVLLYPASAEPFVAYFSVSIDNRSLAEIEELYALELPEVEKNDTSFAGQPAVQYAHPGGRLEYYVTHGGRIFLILTDRPNQEQVQGILKSLKFQD